FVMFFFFQAEDGIRDRNVTGVQTCALPILSFFCCLMRMVAVYPFTSFIITRKVWRFLLRHLEVRWVFFMFTFNTFWNGQVIWIIHSVPWLRTQIWWLREREPCPHEKVLIVFCIFLKFKDYSFSYPF